MLKEIFEQPRAVTDTIRGRLSEEKGDVILDNVRLDRETLKKIHRIVLIACGTSYHAALVGKFLIEEFCRIPVEADIGSEFRYRNPIIGKNDLIVAISQSGETADTLAALREGKRKGAKTLSICNVVESSLARDSDHVIYTHAGPEIGVASTKTFATQLITLFLLALRIGREIGRLSEKEGKALIEELDPASSSDGRDAQVLEPGRSDRQKIPLRQGLPLSREGNQLSRLPWKGR